MSIAYRPSHADATYDMKYGVRAVQVMPKYHPSIVGSVIILRDAVFFGSNCLI